MKIKDVKQAQPASDLKVEKDHIYFFIGNDRKQQMNRMRGELGIPENQARTLVFTTSLQGLSKWSLVVFDGYDPNQLTQALSYHPKQVFNGLTGDDTGTSDGNPTTPLEKAVLHLMKIGSTNRKELEAMSKQFITEKGACEKLGISYWIYAKERIKDQIRALYLVGAQKIVLLITEEFFNKSEFNSLQLLGAFFNCEVKIDNSVEDYKLTGEENVSIQKH